MMLTALRDAWYPNYPGLVSERQTEVERLKAEAEKLGVNVEVVESTPDSGTLTFLGAKRRGEIALLPGVKKPGA